VWNRLATPTAVRLIGHAAAQLVQRVVDFALRSTLGRRKKVARIGRCLEQACLPGEPFALQLVVAQHEGDDALAAAGGVLDSDGQAAADAVQGHLPL